MEPGSCEVDSEELASPSKTMPVTWCYPLASPHWGTSGNKHPGAAVIRLPGQAKEAPCLS
jgi:hypothetical protein